MQSVPESPLDRSSFTRVPGAEYFFALVKLLRSKTDVWDTPHSCTHGLISFYFNYSGPSDRRRRRPYPSSGRPSARPIHVGTSGAADCSGARPRRHSAATRLEDGRTLPAVTDHTASTTPAAARRDLWPPMLQCCDGKGQGYCIRYDTVCCCAPECQ